MKIEGWRARWLIAFGYRLVKIWARTLRFTVEDQANMIGASPNERYIGAVWHNRLLFVPLVIRRYLPERRGAGLISASRDGTLIANFVRRFDFEIVRGSSSRRGAGAMRELAEVIAQGKDALITPDGPRGPAYELGQGIIFLAQQSGAAILPIHLEYSACWRVKSWDRFILPKPFSRVRVIFGPFHHVKPTTNEAEFEAERQRLQEAMTQLVERR